MQKDLHIGSSKFTPLKLNTPLRSDFHSNRPSDNYSSTQADSIVKMMTSYMPALTPIYHKPKRTMNIHNLKSAMADQIGSDSAKKPAGLNIYAQS